MAEVLNWVSCQENSDAILASGFLHLQSQAISKAAEVACANPGNYLLSLNRKACYIGEAKSICSRIRQQFTEKTSTFYKAYAKAVDRPRISDFNIQTIETGIGRKEVEEFTIVNGQCALNKFQLDKRAKVGVATSIEMWTAAQSRAEKIISEGVAIALSKPFEPWFKAIAPKYAGLYIVRSAVDGKIIYVGESSSVSKRHKCHSGRTYFSALRRHIGTELLGFTSTVRNGKAKYFSDAEDLSVTDYLRECHVACLSVHFGRYELEERLIRENRPLLNRKDNKTD